MIGENNHYGLKRKKKGKSKDRKLHANKNKMVKEIPSKEITKNREKQKKSSKNIQDISLLEDDSPINDLSSSSDSISDDDAGDSDFILPSYKYEGKKRTKERKQDWCLKLLEKIPKMNQTRNELTIKEELLFCQIKGRQQRN